MTIRAMDEDLERGIEAMAKERDWSINQVATYLMRRGLGLTDGVAPRVIGGGLDLFMGRWEAEEAGAFEGEVEAMFGQVDDEHWT